MLKPDLLFAPHRVGGEARDELDEFAKTLRRIGGEGRALELQDLGKLKRVVRVAERPTSLRRRTAVSLLHEPKERVAPKRSVPGDGVGNRPGGADRGFVEVAFAGCG